jgi:hypothetical protein
VSTSPTPLVTPVPDPLDTLLRQIAERASSERARAWARRLLEQGEAATGGITTTSEQTPTADPAGPAVDW